MQAPDPLEPVLKALTVEAGASSDFDLNPIKPAQPRKLRAAGVLVPFMVENGRAEIILTKRASGLQHHPGQIAFPGDKHEESDASVEAAALREAHEEIGLDPANVAILGTMPVHETVTGFRVTPVLGRVLSPFDARPEPSEVDEVFRVPLAHVAEPARYTVQSRIWLGQRRYYYAAPFGPYYIWGATARILRGLAERMTT